MVLWRPITSPSRTSFARLDQADRRTDPQLMRPLQPLVRNCLGNSRRCPALRCQYMGFQGAESDPAVIPQQECVRP